MKEYRITFKNEIYSYVDIEAENQEDESNKSAKKPYEDYDYKTDKVLLDHYLNM